MLVRVGEIKVCRTNNKLAVFLLNLKVILLCFVLSHFFFFFFYRKVPLRLACTQMWTGINLDLEMPLLLHSFYTVLKEMRH